MDKFLPGNKRSKEYEIIEKIGSGGFGIVYKAKDSEDNIRAIKVFKNDGILDEEEAKIDWVREAKQSLGIKDGNVITSYDFIDIKVEDGETKTYLVMEYANNGSMRQFVDERRKTHEFLGEEELVDIFKQLLSGISAIHKTTLHRDIKPENILIVGDILKLSDFGLAKYVDETTRTRTYKGWGTYKYMAPESWILGKMSKATDIYSLGIVFYELATLELPFSSADIKELEELHRFGDRPRARSLNSKISTKLDGVIYKMMLQAPLQRYQSTEEVLEELSSASVSSSFSPSWGNVIPLAQKIHTEETHQEVERSKRHEFEQERIKMNRVQIKGVLDTIDKVISQFNQQFPERKLSLSKGTDDDYRIIWGNVDLINIRINPYVGEMQLERGKEIITSVVEIDYCPRSLDGEGANFVLNISSHEDYGNWRVMDVKRSVFLGQGPVYSLVLNARLLDYVKNVVGIGEYGYEIKDGVDEEMVNIIKRALELYDKKEEPQLDFGSWPHIVEEEF